MIKAQSKADILIHTGIISIISLALIALFFYIYLPVTTSHGEMIPVPDLKGKTVDQAEKILKDQDLRYLINDSSYIEGSVPYSIISQHPMPGSKVKGNRKIYITVTAKTPPMVPMPQLKDGSLKAAEMKLKNSGLVLGEIKHLPSPFANLVLRQFVKGKEITSGTHIPKGTVINLEVGNGSMTTEMELTNFVGMNIDDAKALLTEQGLTVGLEKREQVKGKESATVIKQKPEFKVGAKIRMGDSVDLWYAE